VARELRRDPATAATLLVALTGYGDEEDRRRSREAGFDHHLTKPAEPGALLQLLTESG
jgi:CheY-like chemotaxis protein